MVCNKCLSKIETLGHVWPTFINTVILFVVLAGVKTGVDVICGKPTTKKSKMVPRSTVYRDAWIVENSSCLKDHITPGSISLPQIVSDGLCLQSDH